MVERSRNIWASLRHRTANKLQHKMKSKLEIEKDFYFENTLEE